METAPSKRLFTAEIQRRRALAEKNGNGSASAAMPDTSGVSNAEVLAAVNALRAEVRGLSARMDRQEQAVEGVAEHAANIREQEAEIAVQARLEEVNQLRNELRALSRAIEETKSEIAALHPGDEDEDRLLVVTNELDAVVKATERATEGILESAERIDDLAQSLRLNASGEDERNIIDEMLERTVGIFEACNFQDLTGQRITKVVRTLEFVEERILSMIEIWGPENLTADPSVVNTKEGDEALLNGPQLENKGISQDEIDALFD